MSDNEAEEENVYKKYSIRSEHAIFLTTSTNKCDSCKFPHNRCCCQHPRTRYEAKKSSLWIEGKPWEFTYEPYQVRLQMLKRNSSARDDGKIEAEILFWYWNDKKEIVILHQKVHDDFSNLISKKTPEQLPANNKYNVVIRLLDNRKDNGNNSILESYYGDFGKSGIEIVTLNICGTNGETEASFTVPKYVLIQSSAVFHRMFTSEMTEKATGEVKIEDTNAEEFGDFLKAISPKQEHPNPSNVRALLKLADRYECQVLRNRCEAHLTNCIEIPLVERIKCAKFYELNDLKENLLMNFEGTGILELYRDAKPQFDLLLELTTMIE